MATRGRNSWLEDFSHILKRDSIRSLRRRPEYEVFTGPKWPLLPWLSLVATMSGAFGGTLVSASLWSRWWQVPLWLMALVAFVFVVRRATTKIAGQPIGFLAGWCIFFGVLVGAFTMWAAQLTSTAWTYGIAGGAVFFLLGITGGLIEPPNSKRMEDWFMTSAISAPLSSCFAAWLYRNLLAHPGTLEAAALTGALAAFPFLTLTMSLHLLAWRPERAARKLADLYLHNNSFTGEAVALLNSAEKIAGHEAWLYGRRGLAHALAGNDAGAEADWKRHLEIEPKSNVPDLARGWVALRRDLHDKAAKAFAAALDGHKTDPWPLIGIGIARLRQSDAKAALDALKKIPAKHHDALSLTYLAEAYFATGDADMAASSATYAIDELDSVHGRSWLVRADARVVLGDIDGAARDYNKATWAGDEVGVDDRALAGLTAISRPVEEYDPDEDEGDD